MHRITTRVPERKTSPAELVNLFGTEAQARATITEVHEQCVIDGKTQLRLLAIASCETVCDRDADKCNE